ncbi:hypothetical protein CYLTODRAFT_489535 [Cylindrobasidium torrendii FP15055 ss-10]|uniref:Uncharacterized protein n=1 Tax=Cylindrobasidium torrendii FP15055 ss-10 TaxID=1314674 RepID=A0A0D7BF33_9AGAR|nr:hypothetical protein CYLTODRAFT_489535 [Cylindrobasidium torrendii FP15055 ss-10]
MLHILRGLWTLLVALLFPISPYRYKAPSSPPATSPEPSSPSYLAVRRPSRPSLSPNDARRTPPRPRPSCPNPPVARSSPYDGIEQEAEFRQETKIESPTRTRAKHSRSPANAGLSLPLPLIYVQDWSSVTVDANLDARDCAADGSGHSPFVAISSDSKFSSSPTLPDSPTKRGGHCTQVCAATNSKAPEDTITDDLSFPETSCSEYSHTSTVESSDDSTIFTPCASPSFESHDTSIFIATPDSSVDDDSILPSHFAPSANSTPRKAKRLSVLPYPDLFDFGQYMSTFPSSDTLENIKNLLKRMSYTPAIMRSPPRQRSASLSEADSSYVSTHASVSMTVDRSFSEERSWEAAFELSYPELDPVHTNASSVESNLDAMLRRESLWGMKDWNIEKFLRARAQECDAV